MRRFILSLAILTVTVGAAQGETPSMPAAGAPHHVGLIDMAFVFKNYRKFKNMTEELQKEIEGVDQEARGKVEQLKQLQKQLLDKTQEEGTPEFVNLEKQMMKAQTELETFKRSSQREFLRKEADIYKTVYLEVEDAVRRYAQYYHYSIVLRFSRDGVDGAENPRDIINGMNRQVLYYVPQDDLTEPILTYLNAEWDKKIGAVPGAAAPESAMSPQYDGVKFTR